MKYNKAFFLIGIFLLVLTIPISYSYDFYYISELETWFSGLGCDEEPPYKDPSGIKGYIRLYTPQGVGTDTITQEVDLPPVGETTLTLTVLPSDCCSEEGQWYVKYVTRESPDREAASNVYFIDYDSQEGSCIEPACNIGIWDPEAENNKGECCGDDPFGANPSATDHGIDDPDMGSISCTSCKQGQFEDNPSYRNWDSDVPDSNNRCCGDDTLDCQAVSNSFICSDTTTTPIDSWYWRNAKESDYTGVIIDSECKENNFAFLSNGNTWLACPSNPDLARFDFDFSGVLANNEVKNPYDVAGHDYLCYNEDQDFRLAECCAGSPNQSSSCNNDYSSQDLGGIELFTGNSRIANQRAFFCREDFSISEDLDEHPFACEMAAYPNGTSREYLWTGTKCCSEPADIDESYNDPDGEGACLFNEPIKNTRLSQKFEEIASVEGMLWGCKIDAIKYKDDNEFLLDVNDSYTGELVVQNQDYCTLTLDGDYFCDYSEQWKRTFDQNLSNFVVVPDEWGDVDLEAGCCPPDYCWTGEGCRKNQAPNPTDPPDRDNYRCSNGEWVYSELKKGLDGHYGYCPRNEECFVGLKGTFEDNNNPEADPICIADGQYIEDNYCENGNWSSRTKYISLALLALIDSSENHTLYCGPPSDTLNYIDYTTTPGRLFVKSIFDENKANNFCLLDYNDNLIIATSINTELNDTGFISEIFPEFEECDPFGNNGFESCNRQSSDKAWLNEELKSIIYSKKSIQLNPNPSYIQIFNSFIQNPISTLLSILQQTEPTKSFSYEFVEQGMKYDRIYILKKDDRNIISTLDEANIIIKYDSVLEKDVCEIIRTYNETHMPLDQFSNAQIACNQVENTFNIVATGGEFTNIDTYAIWSDLTGKLRLK
ncbi:MAG: hypothetical protein KAK00_09070 [Nanoarchaeota archaeon]|nr:hypothetical protein [Nanoarchaeota archaeon]